MSALELSNLIERQSIEAHLIESVPSLLICYFCSVLHHLHMHIDIL